MTNEEIGSKIRRKRNYLCYFRLHGKITIHKTRDMTQFADRHVVFYSLNRRLEQLMDHKIDE